MKYLIGFFVMAFLMDYLSKFFYKPRQLTQEICNASYLKWRRYKENIYSCNYKGEHYLLYKDGRLYHYPEDRPFLLVEHSEWLKSYYLDIYEYDLYKLSKKVVEDE